jgi:hypothetical protein
MVAQGNRDIASVIAEVEQVISAAAAMEPSAIFDRSIDPRYQRYLDHKHGLKFKPRASYRLSLVFNQVSSALEKFPLHSILIYIFPQVSNASQPHKIPLDHVSDDTIDGWLAGLLGSPSSHGTPPATAGSHPSLHLM